MPKLVRHFQTSDGRLFPTRAKAEDHELSIAHENIANVLKPLVDTGKINAHDLYRINTTLLPSYAALQSFVRFLLPLVEHDPNADDE